MQVCPKKFICSKILWTTCLDCLCPVSSFYIRDFLLPSDISWFVCSLLSQMPESRLFVLFFLGTSTFLHHVAARWLHKFIKISNFTLLQMTFLCQIVLKFRFSLLWLLQYNFHFVANSTIVVQVVSLWCTILYSVHVGLIIAVAWFVWNWHLSDWISLNYLVHKLQVAAVEDPRGR